MSVRFFCDKCGKEIFQDMPQCTKRITTIAVAEEQCKCSDCLMAEYRERASRPKEEEKE